MYALIDNTYFIPRWFASVPLALAFTFALLTVMLKLVFTDFEAPIEEPPLIIEDVVYEHKVIDTFQAIDKVEKPEVQEIPEIPDLVQVDPADIDVTIPAMDVRPIKSTGTSIVFDGMPVAQYLVSAKYPNNALRRGIEGYVDVRFDITAMGTTENISVMRANPQGVFEKSAIAAVQRWRYQPKTVEGIPHAFEGMTQRITFVLGE